MAPDMSGAKPWPTKSRRRLRAVFCYGKGRRGGRETTRDTLDDEFAHSFGLIRFIACTSLLACHCVRSPLNNPKYLMRPEMCLGER